MSEGTTQGTTLWDTPRGEAVRIAVLKLSGELVRYRQGIISDDEFRPTRTVLAAYGQRQPEQFMVRVRLPYGAVTPPQLRVLAEVARQYGSGRGHLTTRQDMQLHWLALDDIPTVLQRLGDAGLITLQSGGNSVRNVAACPLAGTCHREAFDVSPYAEAVDEFYVGNPAVQSLPRKFKSSFSGCPADCAFSAIQDFGAVAVQRGENGSARRGFQVFIGGGLGSVPRPAFLLEDFVPAEDVLPTYEAMVRVFARLGDRTRKDRARLKFVVARLGEEEVRRLVREEREAVRREDLAFPTVRPGEEAFAPALQTAASGVRSAEYERWLNANVLRQRQNGVYSAVIALPLGDITSEQMEAVADLAEDHPGRSLRTSVQQNLYLRGIAESALPAVYEGLHAVGLTALRANGIADVVSCPGTSACSLGIVASKGLAAQVQRLFLDKGYQDDPAIGTLTVKVSGCPDACAQHYLADIGLSGAVLHQNGHLYPAFVLDLGGKVDEKGTKLGQPVMKLPARKVPQALERLLAFYRAERGTDEAFGSFVDRVGVKAIRELLGEFTRIPPIEEDRANFIDWDATRMYVLERGEGECSV